MKNKIFIIAISLVLVLLLISSCNFMEQFENMQSQGRLNTYATTTKDADKSVEGGGETDPDQQQGSEEGQPGASDGAGSPEAPPAERTEPKAPDFTVFDNEGNPVKLSDYLGKPVVLNFWASWCGPCQREMPAFQQKFLELGSEVQFLMVNLTGGRETVDSASSFISKNGYTFPVFFDTSYSASNAFSVYSIPATYFIDAEGYIVANAVGAINEDVIGQGIDMINGE